MADSTAAATAEVGFEDRANETPEAREQHRCQGQTKSGRPCRLYAQPGSNYCAVHEPSPPAHDAAPSEDELRQLAAELEELGRRLQAATAEEGSSGFAGGARRWKSRLREAGSRVTHAGSSVGLERLRGVIKPEWLDPDTWKGTWYMLNYVLKYQADMVKRRFTGEYETDDWGLDLEFLDAMRPLLSFAYKTYWRVEATGIDQIPIEGRAVLAGNHSGRLPWEGVMVATAILRDHPAQRLVRTLHEPWVPEVPVWSHVSLKLGQALATVENGVQLLEQDELVAVYPEGDKAAQRPFRERYRLAPFDGFDFVTMALETGAPIVPVSVVGAADSSLSLLLSPWEAWKPGGSDRAGFGSRLHMGRFSRSGKAGWPGRPVKWAGALAGGGSWSPIDLISLPTKWYVDFGEPLPTEPYGPEAAGDPALASQLGDQIRNIVQGMVSDRLAERRSAFG